MSDCNAERQALQLDMDAAAALEAAEHKVSHSLEERLEKLKFPNPTLAQKILREYQAKRLQTDPAFDLTKLLDKRLVRIVERQQDLKGQLKSEDNETEQTETAVSLLKNYETRINDLKEGGNSNIEIIQSLTNDPATPESEREKLQAFQSILSIAQAVPADAQIIATRMNTMDFSQGIPNPKEFVTWAVFDSPNLSSGISEATQSTIAAKLGITRHQNSVKTGRDVKEVFEKGLGVETYLDEHGEVQTRTVPLAPGQDVKIRDNQFLSVDHVGNKHLRITTAVGDYQISLPDNPTDEDMTQIVVSTQMIAAFHDLNLAEVFYDRPLTERGGGEIDLRFPGDFNRTKQLCQILFGGAAGYDGEILEQSDINKIPYLMQFHNSKGDAMRGDVAPEMMRKELEAQGAIKNGSVNWLRFEEMVTANRANMYVAPENSSK